MRQSLRKRRASTLGSDLAARAVPGAAAADTGLLDQRSTAKAGLAGSPVDAELMLHRAGRAVGASVIPKGRPLPNDPIPEGAANPAEESRNVFARKVFAWAERVDSGPPERLVGIDVPDAGK